MKSKNLLVLAVIFIVPFGIYAQGHIATGKYACQLVPESLGYEKYSCPACASIRQQKENDAKAAEIRQIAINRENDKKAKEKSIDDAKKLKQETAEKNKMTEVRLVMPSSSSNSGNSEAEFIKPSVNASTSPSSTSSTTSNSASQATIYNNMFLAERAKKYNDEKAMNDLAKGVIDLFSPSPEKVQRERAEKEASINRYQKNAQEEIRLKVERFKSEFLSYKHLADKNNTNLRMLIYFSGVSLAPLIASEYLLNMREWISEAAKNKNLDALIEKAMIEIQDNKYGKQTRYMGPEPGDYNFKETIPALEYAANLGSADAMMLLAGWYDKVPYTSKGFASYFCDGGNDAEKALKYFKNAAEAGSPNAMYYLGLIYKYGRITSKTTFIEYDGKTVSKSNQKYHNSQHVIYKIEKDETKAFEWFLKSVQPEHKQSLSSMARKLNGQLTYTARLSHYYSYFNRNTYLEIAEIFEKGKIVPKDKVKAQELRVRYWQYIDNNKF